MIDSINQFPSPSDALAAFSAAGLVTVDRDGVESIIKADIDGLAICEVGQRYTLISPGTPSDPFDPPIYAGDGFHWVVYRHMNQDILPSFLAPTVRWHSKMADAGGLAVPRPTDGSVPNQFWL